MKTAHDFLREHIFASLGLTDIKRLPSLEELRRTEWCPEFETLQRNRLIMGAFRYGLFHDHKENGGSPHDNVASIEKHAQLYRETGNMEHLLDIANLAMKEWDVGVHPNKHFAATDDADHHTEMRRK